MPIEISTAIGQGIKEVLGTTPDGSLKPFEELKSEIIANVETPMSIGEQNEPQD